MNTKPSRVLVTAALSAILTLTGACDHNGDDADPKPSPGEDGGGY